MFWFDQASSRFLTPEERVEQAQKQAQQAQQALEDLRNLLQQRGIDPDNL